MAFTVLRIKRPEDQSLPFDFPRGNIQPTIIPKAEPIQPPQPSAFQQLGTALFNNGPVRLFNDIKTKGWGAFSMNDIINRNNPLAGLSDLAKTQMNNIAQQNHSVLNNPINRRLNNIVNTPHGAEDVLNKAVSVVGNAPVVRDLKSAPVLNTLNKYIVSPVAHATATSAGRVGSASVGNRPYAEGGKGYVQGALDAANLAAPFYAPVKAGVLAQGGKAALKAAPGAFARGVAATGLMNIGNQINEGRDLKNIDYKSAAISAAMGGGLNVAVPYGSGAVSRGANKVADYIKSPKALTQAGHIQPGADLNVPNSGNLQYTAKLLDKAQQDLRAGKITKKQFDAIATDRFTQTYGRMPTKDELVGFNPDATSPRKAALQQQFQEQVNQAKAPQVGKTDPLEALKAEARKYKSAEEFVKAQGETVYHRSPNKFDKFDLSKVSQDSNKQRYGWGMYFSDTVPHEQYGNYLYESRLPKGTLIDSKKPVDKEIVNKIVKAVKENNKNPSELQEFSYNGYLFYKTLSRILGGDKDASLFLSKNGVAGLKNNIGKNANDYILFNTDSIKTKAQLTDLYNQATAPQVGKTAPSMYSKGAIGQDVSESILQSSKPTVVAANELSAPTGKFGNARSLQPDELQAIQGGMKQKVAGNVKANLSALELEQALKQTPGGNNISQGYKAFSDIQAGKYNNTEAGKLLRSAFDDAHKQAIQAGLPSGYIDNYIPQLWKQNDKQVAKILQSNGIKVTPGFTAHRQIPSYEWGIEHGLTPAHTKTSQLYGAYIQQLESAKANIGLINNMREAGVLTSSRKAPAGWEPMNLKGFEDMSAPAHVAKVLRSVIGPIDQPASVVAQKVASFNSNWQNIVLSGGIPYTPENFFAYGQLFKETATGIGGTAGLLKGDTLGVRRFGVWADFVRAHSGEMTNSQILKNKDLITGLAERGVDLRFQGQIDTPSTWHRAIDNPTFGRFLPLIELRTARDVVAKATKKGMSNSEAMDLAAQAVHVYHGINNNLVGLRSKDVQNMITATTFAPQFRESLLNIYGNTAKAFLPGSGKAGTLNRYMAGGLGAVFLGYNLLNQQLNGGKNMWQNEPGKEMSLQIPYGEPDSRGVRKAIFIPFAPSFFTIPRNLVEGTSALAHGDIPQATRNASTNLAMPLQLGTQLIANRDYYGRPIYNTNETVDVNGQSPDSTGAALAKAGSYVFKQTAIPSVRGAVEYFGEKKPAGQAIATGLELPVRYGRVTPEETQSYFKSRDQVLSKVSKATRDDYRAIHSGDNGAPTPFYSSAEKATSMIKENGGLTELYQAEKKIAQRENNKYPSDPLYSLPDNKAFVVLKLQQLQGTARGGAESKQLKADNPWLAQFYKQRTAFYDSQNIPEKDRVMPPYEEPSSQVAAKLDRYNRLSSADKTNFLRANPDVTDYFAKSFDYTNLVRKMQGVAEFAKRPQPSSQTQAKLDYYNTLPKQTGARSSFLRNNPDVTQFFADLKYYDEAGPFGTGIAAGGGGSNKSLAKIQDSVYGSNSQYASSRSYSKSSAPKAKPFYYKLPKKTASRIAKPAISVPQKIGKAPIKIVAKRSKA